MSILISKYYSDVEVINTTADYNLAKYVKSLSDAGKLNSSKIVCWSLGFITKLLKNVNIVDYVKEKYNMDLKNLVFFDLYHRVPTHMYTCLKDINIYLYIIDNHGEIEIENYRYVDFIKNDQLKLLCTYAYNLGAASLQGLNFKYNYFFPHCVIHKCEFNENPINQILITGRGTGNYQRYPYRIKMQGLTLYKKNRPYIHRFKPDVPYRATVGDKRTWGSKFIKKLNQYLVAFCDDGNIKTNFTYIFAKFFEAMSAGCLLLTHNKNTKIYFEKLGLVENEDYMTIDLDKSNDEIMSHILKILSPSNRPKIDKIRMSGYRKAWMYHSTEARFKDLLGIIGGNDKYAECDDGIKGTHYLVKNYHLNRKKENKDDENSEKIETNQ